MAKYVSNKRSKNKKPNQNSNFNKSTNNKKITKPKVKEPLIKEVIFVKGMTVSDLATAMRKPVAEIIKKLMFMRIMASQTQEISRENAELLAME